MHMEMPVEGHGSGRVEAGRIDDAKRLAERAYTRKPEEQAVFEYVQQIRAAEQK